MDADGSCLLHLVGHVFNVKGLRGFLPIITMNLIRDIFQPGNKECGGLNKPSFSFST